MNYTLTMLDFLLDLIFPRICIGCGKWGKYFCEKCTAKIDYFNDQVCPYCERPSLYGLTHPRCQKPLGLDGMFVLAHYQGPIREAIRQIKYQGSFAIVSELAKLIGQKYHRQYIFDYLVPVPLAKNREAERGFNQAEKLANHLNYAVQVMNCLERVRETKPQFDLKLEERRENVKDAFSLISNFKLASRSFGTQISNSSVCLVDDVATTGATIFECAKALKQAGARKVYAICAARGGMTNLQSQERCFFERRKIKAIAMMAKKITP